MRTVQKLLSVALVLSVAWAGLSTSVYAQLADSPWPMYGHDPQHTGRSPYSGPETPGTKWKVETGDKVDSSPAIGPDGTVYVGSWDHHLYAINPDGSVKWKYETGAMVRSSPAIGADGTIYVGSSDGHVYAINPDGSLKWKYDVMDSIWGSSPAIGSDGTVYVGSFGRNLYAIHPDGSLKWKYKAGDYIGCSPAIGADGTVYMTLPLTPSRDFTLYAFNPDGTVKWECEDVGGNSGASSGSDGTIYVGSEDDHLYAIHPDGSLKWKYETGGRIETRPAIGSDGTIYVGSDDKRLYAINPDGSLKWKYRTGHRIRSSVAIGPNSTIYVGSQDRNLYAIYVGNEQEIEVVPTTDLVIYEEGPDEAWTIKASSKADSDPYATTVVHSGNNAHAVTIQRPGEKIPGKITYTFEDPDGVVLFGYSHLSFWIYPGDADIQKLVLDIGGREWTVDEEGKDRIKLFKPDLIGDMGLDLSGDRWIEVRIPLEDLRGETERMPFLKLSGTVTGTFYVDDMKLELAEPTAVEMSEGMALPSGYALSQNYPNPFNPETTIRYAVAKTSTVRLSVYALTGQLVRTLVDGEHAAGRYSVTWDGTDDAGRDVASGVYLCRMVAGEYRAVRKMLVTR